MWNSGDKYCGDTIQKKTIHNYLDVTQILFGLYYRGMASSPLRRN
jgi:hypothetical protein